jgi:hypothetical protein
MYTGPIILPLTLDGSIYALQDEKGTIIGTGTREVCEVLVQIMNDQANARTPRMPKEKPVARPNIRAAIVI